MTLNGRWPSGERRAAAFSLLPMLTTLGGAYLDEQTHLGFSLWRAACRGGGLSLSSLPVFTIELLPLAVLGALAGALLLQFAGLLRAYGCTPGTALAAHGGCLLGMGVGLLLCASVLPLPLAIGAETMLAAVTATALVRSFATSAVRNPVLPTSLPAGSP